MPLRYYYLQLRQDFMHSDFVRYLLDNGGGDLLVIFLYICLATINTDGVLSSKIGEIEIAYTPETLAGKIPHYTPEEISNALKVFERAGYLLENENGQLFVRDFAEWIGSISPEGLKKRRQRKGQKANNARDNVPENVQTTTGKSQDNIPDNVDIDRTIARTKNEASKEKYIYNPADDFLGMTNEDIPF